MLLLKIPVAVNRFAHHFQIGCPVGVPIVVITFQILYSLNGARPVVATVLHLLRFPKFAGLRSSMWWVIVMGWGRFTIGAHAGAHNGQ